MKVCSYKCGSTKVSEKLDSCQLYLQKSSRMCCCFCLLVAIFVVLPGWADKKYLRFHQEQNHLVFTSITDFNSFIAETFHIFINATNQNNHPLNIFPQELWTVWLWNSIRKLFLFLYNQSQQSGFLWQQPRFGFHHSHLVVQNLTLKNKNATHWTLCG